MNFIVFLGHHKVGSTSLQHFFAKNSTKLLNSGILYPCVDFECMALMARRMGLETDVVDTMPINAREPHNALAFRMINEENGAPIPPYHKNLPSSAQMLNAISQQIKYFSPSVVILAAEVFSNFSAICPKSIHKLSGFFGDHKVRFVLTLRKIDDYLVSWHGQRLKFGEKINPLNSLDVLKAYTTGIHFDYRLLLSGWVAAFPKSEFIVRNYDDVLANGGACNDFVNVSGLELPSDMTPVENKNPSFHRSLMELVRIGNFKFNEAQAKELRRFMLDVVKKAKLPANNLIEMFGKEGRHLLYKSFNPINDYLKPYAKGGDFFVDIENLRIVNEIDESDAVSMALDVLLNDDYVMQDYLKEYFEQMRQFSPE